MDRDSAAETSVAMDLGIASASSSLNGYGGSSHGETDVLVLIGAAFAGGLLLGVLVSRLVS